MWLTVFLAGLLLVLLFLLPYYAMNLSRAGRLVARLPGPTPLPLIGNVLLFGFTPTDIMKNITAVQEKYGFFVRVWFGPLLFLFVADPKVAEHFLTSNVNIKKSLNYRFLESWLGTGLLTSKGSKWRNHRKIITPTFHFKILEQFIDVFNANGKKMVQKLKGKVGASEFDVYQYVTLHALDVICEAAMGVQMNVQDNKNNEYVSALQRLSEIITLRSFSPWVFPSFIFNMSSYGREEKKLLKVLHNMSYTVIANRKKELFHEKKADEENNSARVDDVGQKRRMAFLDLLLNYNHDGGDLTIEEIREEVDTFMFEGHDTTASAMTFCLWMLARNPECQEKAYQEQYEIFGDTDREITAEDLQNMKYLECVIKETLRLYPSVPFFLRELEEDVKIDDMTILAGTTIVLSPFYMGRNPEYFPVPEKFDPDRFSADNVRGRHPYAFVPFSAGPRNCIGQKFAMMEVKSLISEMLRNFKIYPGSKEIEISLEIILRTASGVFIKLENRK